MAAVEIRYEDYELMIYRAAWKFHNVTGLDWDDLFSQGNEIYCQAVDRYKPGMGKFSTFLQNSLNQYLLNYVQIPYQREDKDPLDGPLYGGPEDPFRTTALKQAIDRLSAPAKYLIELVMDVPDGLMIACRKQTASGDKFLMCRERIIEYLRKDEGWSLYKCWKAMDEIKAALATF